MKALKENKVIHYIFIIIISALISIPFLKVSLLCTGDTVLHLLRVLGLKFSIGSSSFPYIITPFYCNNFGYATNLFYPQITTYAPYLLGFITNSYESAMYLFAFFTVILSGIFMYNFVNQIIENKIIALISSVIYLTFPYRFENMYERFAIGEFTALVFLPILFQGLHSLINKNGEKHYLISVGAIGLLLSHTITTLYAAIFCILYILFNIKSFIKKDVIKLCIINVVFIVLCTALFTMPVFEHKMKTEYTIFNAERMNGMGINVQDNSASFKQLITDKDSNKTVSFTIGLPIILYIIIGIFTYKKYEKEEKEWYELFCVLGLISLYMVTSLFPWKLMPNSLTMIQFSWRMLVFFNLFIAPVCALNIYSLIKNISNKKIKILLSVILSIILVACTAYRLNQFVVEKSVLDENHINYETRVINNPKISHMNINREYLPEKVGKNRYEHIKNREDKTYIKNGNAEIISEFKDNQYMEIEMKNGSDSILELPYIYYLGYKIDLYDADNNLIEIDYYESDDGFVQIKIPEDIENCKIIIRYTGTFLEKASYIVSALGIVGLTIYIIRFKRKEKRVG